MGKFRSQVEIMKKQDIAADKIKKMINGYIINKKYKKLKEKKAELEKIKKLAEQNFKSNISDIE